MSTDFVYSHATARYLPFSLVTVLANDLYMLPEYFTDVKTMLWELCRVRRAFWPKT
jgi:hypothetical protein